MASNWEIARWILDGAFVLVGFMMKLEVANLRVWVLENFVLKKDCDERHGGRR